MPIETLEPSKLTHTYEWRCLNAKCHALMRAREGDCRARIWKTPAERFLEFQCPHCQWCTQVPE